MPLRFIFELNFADVSFQFKLKLYFVVLFCVALFGANCGGKRDAAVVTTERQPEPPIIKRAARNRFEQNLPAPLDLSNADQIVESRILHDYGALFVAKNVVTPTKIVFADAAECAAWQANVPTEKAVFGAVEIELQRAAMQNLSAARDELRTKNLTLTARGTWAGKRDYRDTEKIWATRITPGLNYWTARGKLTPTEAARIRQLAPAEQTAEILRLEARGMFFSKDFARPVLSSATAPGCSQHLSMLAIDLNENGNAAIRQVLARHGWFQTVIDDLPHFTFLGADEKDLPALGLKRTAQNGRIYWTPDE